jgi:alpha-tubulin suppressor-like RCC1 family protein
VLALCASLMGGCACESVVSVTPRDAGGPDAYRPPVGRYDECGNGLDDDGDGAIDEDCPCGTGESQPCWDGARAERGVGACADGVQQCSATGSNEFGRWLSCTMSRGPGSESCEGTVDEDCDGAIDEGCACTEGASRACDGPSEGACRAGTQTCRSGTWTRCEGAVGPVAELCGNGLDDDCDGLSDDPALCTCSPAPEVCGNGLDDDCDGLSDESPCAAPTPDAGTSDAGTLDTGTPDAGAIADDASLAGDPIVEVTAGADHTCARRSSGRVLCWGSNGSGQLGDGTTEDRRMPTPVTGLLDAVEIDAGISFTCARRSGGGVVCWGDNDTGEIGDGTCSFPRVSGCPAGADRPVPTPVIGLTDAVGLAVGTHHACAPRRSGEVVCWGQNFAGAVGDGTCSGGPLPAEFGAQPLCSGRDRWSPTNVLGFMDAAEITAGGGQTCARRSTGQALCWGRNYRTGLGDGGLVGDGTTINRLVPTPVSDLTDAAHISAGLGHTCAVRSSGAALCWGYNGYGKLGDGTTTSRVVPTPVAGLTDVVEIGAGGGHSCALVADGRVFCWGRNDGGQVGDDTVESRDGGRTSPTQVVDVADFSSLAVGGWHNCGLRRDGTVVCWGWNRSGQLGDGTTTNRPAPRAVRGL